MPLSSATLSLVPKVRIANDFSHSGVRSMNVAPTASSGDAAGAMRTATRCADGERRAGREESADAGGQVADPVSLASDASSRWDREHGGGSRSGIRSRLRSRMTESPFATRVQGSRGAVPQPSRTGATLTLHGREGDGCDSATRSRSSPAAVAGWAAWPPRCSRLRGPRSSSPSTPRRPARRPSASSAPPAGKRPS